MLKMLLNIFWEERMKRADDEHRFLLLPLPSPSTVKPSADPAPPSPTASFLKLFLKSAETDRFSGREVFSREPAWFVLQLGPASQLQTKSSHMRFTNVTERSEVTQVSPTTE